jgi:hypothetical protein
LTLPGLEARCRCSGNATVFERTEELGWHRLEGFETGWQDRPFRTISGEDRHRGMKRRRIIQGACVDRELIVFSDVTTMNEAAAIGTEVAHRIPAAGGFGRKRVGCAGEPHRFARKSEKRHEAGPRHLPAIGATAKAGELRLAFRFVTQGTAEAAARPTFYAFAHMFPHSSTAL